MTLPAPPSAGGRCPQKYPPALGRGGGAEEAVVAPPRVCVRPGALPRTFSATNIPLEKLGHPEMKDFFAKYLAQYPLVHPIKKRKYKEEE